jgi:hypothetical protein
LRGWFARGLAFERDMDDPENAKNSRSAVNETRKEVPGVEVLFQ